VACWHCARTFRSEQVELNEKIYGSIQALSAAERAVDCYSGGGPDPLLAALNAVLDSLGDVQRCELCSTCCVRFCGRWSLPTFLRPEDPQSASAARAL